MTEKRFYKTTSDIEDYRIYDDDKEDAYFISCNEEYTIDCLVELMNELADDNENLKNRVDELEDDNMKYTLSTDKLEEYTKRFMPTKCINEFRDCKTNRYYWLDNEDNFTGALELLNLLDCENEQLKQDNNALIHLLENQSMIIQELRSKLLEYQVKEPIVLTKKDLELMGKAISYYTHGRCGE